MALEAIMAIGENGQLGLDGELPWHDADDLRWFKAFTTDKTLIVGANTAEKLPPLPGREVIVWTRENFESLVGLDAVVIGGAATYEKFAPYIKRWHIGKISYRGDADAWFNPMMLLGGE